MAEKKNLPEIRFKGFTEEWKENELGAIANFSKGQGYSKKDLVESGTQIILYGRLYTKYQAVISKVDTFVDCNGASNYSTGNEVIVPASGETAEDIARASAVVKSGILLGGDLNIIYPNNQVNTVFLAFIISNGKTQRDLSKRAQGKSVVHLHNSDLKEVVIHYPCYEEQNNISTFIKHLDHLITLHQSKYDKLVNVKKALLEKMFPKKDDDVPEIRFKGFEGKWGMKMLGTTKTYFTDGNYGEAYPSANDLTDRESGVPFLRGNNLSNGVLSKNGANYITNEKHSELTSGHLVEDDIVIAVRGSLGALGYVDKANVGWNINSQLAIIRTYKEELKGNYLIQYLLSDFGQKIIISKSTGTALKQLPIGKLKEINIPLTNIEEQSKIGTFFKHLDHLLFLQQQELEKLKNIKKACLEKMFV